MALKVDYIVRHAVLARHTKSAEIGRDRGPLPLLNEQSTFPAAPRFARTARSGR